MNDVGRVTYFNGQMPVFVHDTNDIRPFRLITSQFCVNTNSTQGEGLCAAGPARGSGAR
jgi:hypothetical protein